jgi:hypothetical protein
MQHTRCESLLLSGWPRRSEHIESNLRLSWCARFVQKAGVLDTPLGRNWHHMAFPTIYMAEGHKHCKRLL